MRTTSRGSWTPSASPPGPARSATARFSCSRRNRPTGSGPGRWDPTRSEPRVGEEAPAHRLTRSLRALDRAYSPGHHGLWSARRRAALVDEAVRALSAGLPKGVAVVAGGGDGRGVPAPGGRIHPLGLPPP